MKIHSTHAVDQLSASFYVGIGLFGRAGCQVPSELGEAANFTILTALRAGPPFSWGVTSGGSPGGRSLSKDGTRADSAKDFCRLVGGVYYAGNLISE